MKVTADDLFTKEHLTLGTDVQIDELKKEMPRGILIFSGTRETRKEHCSTQQTFFPLTLPRTESRVKWKLWSPWEVTALSPRCDLKKEKKNNRTVILSRHAAPCVPQKRSWRSKPFSPGTSDTVMQEPCALAGTWCWEYAETQGWTEAMCRAQHYWVRPELRTDTPSAFRSVCKISWTYFFPCQNTFHFAYSCSHLTCEKIWWERLFQQTYGQHRF